MFLTYSIVRVTVTDINEVCADIGLQHVNVIDDCKEAVSKLQAQFDPNFYFGGFFGHYGDLVSGWPTGCVFINPYSNVLYYIGKEGSNEKDHVKNPGKKRQVCYEGN